MNNGDFYIECAEDNSLFLCQRGNIDRTTITRQEIGMSLPMADAVFPIETGDEKEVTSKMVFSLLLSRLSNPYHPGGKSERKEATNAG